MSPAALRFGALGAARITPSALTDVARDSNDVEVVAVAARDPQRAAAFAEKHRIPQVLTGYEEVVASPDVDCVYVALPNSLHREWTLKALAAGKHVLCEKPLASNAAEAEEMVQAAKAAGRVLVEAFHYRHHPVLARVYEVVRSGTLGRVSSITAEFRAPIPSDDMRFVFALGGGGLMDLGCYGVHAARWLVGEEPEVTGAEVKEGPPQIDVQTRATLRFPGGTLARIDCAMGADAGFGMRLEVQGTDGRLVLTNPFLPHFGHELTIETASGRETETGKGETSYVGQLRAFVAAVRSGRSDGDEAANMRCIDAIYRAAGLRPRGT